MCPQSSIGNKESQKSQHTNEASTHKHTVSKALRHFQLGCVRTTSLRKSNHTPGAHTDGHAKKMLSCWSTWNPCKLQMSSSASQSPQLIFQKTDSPELINSSVMTHKIKFKPRVVHQQSCEAQFQQNQRAGSALHWFRLVSHYKQEWSKLFFPYATHIYFWQSEQHKYIFFKSDPGQYHLWT